MSHIVVSYAGADQSAARLVMGKLKKLGHTVAAAPATRRAQANGSDVLILWSRAYANVPRRPASALATLQLDAAAPPPRLKATAIDLQKWRGREDHPGWRKVIAKLAPVAAPAKTARVAVAAMPVFAPAPIAQPTAKPAPVAPKPPAPHARQAAAPVMTPSLAAPTTPELTVDTYTGPQFLHLGVFLTIVAAIGAAAWYYLPH
jgi:hypothetical protein